WLATESKNEGMKVEFGAEFSEASEARGFRYQVRGVYRWSKRNKAINKTRSAPSPSDRLLLEPLLEDAAQQAFTKAIGGSTETPIGPSNDSTVETLYVAGMDAPQKAAEGISPKGGTENIVLKKGLSAKAK